MENSRFVITAATHSLQSHMHRFRINRRRRELYSHLNLKILENEVDPSLLPARLGCCLCRRHLGVLQGNFMENFIFVIGCYLMYKRLVPFIPMSART